MILVPAASQYHCLGQARLAHFLMISLDMIKYVRFSANFGLHVRKIADCFNFSTFSIVLLNPISCLNNKLAQFFCNKRPTLHI